MKDIRDVIKHAKFGDDRLRGSGVVSGQISAFPIDFAGRPYNTLTLPCERVITSRQQRRKCVPDVRPITQNTINAGAIDNDSQYLRCYQYQVQT